MHLPGVVRRFYFVRANITVEPTRPQLIDVPQCSRMQQTKTLVASRRLYQSRHRGLGVGCLLRLFIQTRTESQFVTLPPPITSSSPVSTCTSYGSPPLYPSSSFSLIPFPFILIFQLISLKLTDSSDVVIRLGRETSERRALLREQDPKHRICL